MSVAGGNSFLRAGGGAAGRLTRVARPRLRAGSQVTSDLDRNRRILYSANTYAANSDPRPVARARAMDRFQRRTVGSFPVSICVCKHLLRANNPSFCE